MIDACGSDREADRARPAIGGRSKTISFPPSFVHAMMAITTIAFSKHASVAPAGPPSLPAGQGEGSVTAVHAPPFACDATAASMKAMPSTPSRAVANVQASGSAGRPARRAAIASAASA